MKILVIVTHPSFDQSRANRALINELSPYDNIDVHNLHDEYPDWNIDIEREQQLLTKYDRIVLQFPLFWYSTPPLLKKWLDDVLAYGWAYGTGGDNLKGKEFIVSTTAGGSEQDYRSSGSYEFTMNEFLRPLQVSVKYTDAIYLPEFVVYGTLKATDDQLSSEARKYVEHIRASADVLVENTKAS
ncbi:NAD(P)H-dependent oxidoreductase [Paenibacillus radicis (ex Gao et al. 2016)]|uniref:NAD(P)H oxidoreductase YrkL n=1 Tax=Paenibacillus radicis (ex Gao et al. 2016) TaxID=1737354 RepID=A0A917H202_9BACL|nr:NAD(P)H-dependent oxidoreductase [Paenibacillus radicis (ex Gao et al. 2016)]GGG64686.1 putative NAD(P)H oxidoreductase YrkL [Paenibacillus radicis (ex Gao et al. 2016)]